MPSLAKEIDDGPALLPTLQALQRQFRKFAAHGILPSGYGDAVDRDIMTIRDATAKFKTTEAAEAASNKRVTGCVQHLTGQTTEAKQLIETWRQEYNESRPHRSLGERTPSEFASQYAASRVLTATQNSQRLTLGSVQENWSDHGSLDGR